MESIFLLNYLLFTDVFLVKNNIKDKLFLYKTRQTCVSLENIIQLIIIKIL